MEILQLLGRKYWYWVKEIYLLYSKFVRILVILIYDWWHRDDCSGLCWGVLVKGTQQASRGAEVSLSDHPTIWDRPWPSPEAQSCMTVWIKLVLVPFLKEGFLSYFWSKEAIFASRFQPVVDTYVKMNKIPPWGNEGKNAHPIYYKRSLHVGMPQSKRI